MRTTNTVLYALRLSYNQVSDVTATAATPNRAVARSAAMMAVFGIALSSFSLKQMLSSTPQVATRKMKH
ncbi:unnamed protein product [Hermetia illucens]|uniref:Uncharacterized protein n=1 Tax=Hermetia illucens TaxID=343691 RepID=A0A7R8UB23_HERIL|nr:uncharacterized protein LOC119647253 [Hermetia illucens]XP_037904061.1 uncharacterized protein LOC119647253 [Hermetia illucens]CAD7077498.1 unnamed protein product [Hermetia illucens]